MTTKRHFYGLSLIAPRHVDANGQDVTAYQKQAAEIFNRLLKRIRSSTASRTT